MKKSLVVLAEYILLIVVPQAYQRWNTQSWATVPKVKMLAPTAEQIEREVKYEANIKAAKVILNGRCAADIPLLAAKAGMDNKIPVRIVAADILIESGCRAQVKSKAGAIGLMQINQKVWKVDGDLRNPEVNIAAGTKILAGNIHRYGYRNGLRRYFGISQGSNASDEYATKVLDTAYHGR